MNFKNLNMSISFLLVFCSALYSQDSNNEYVRGFNNNFTLRPSVSISRLTLQIYEKDSSSKITEYMPNSQFYFGMDITAGGLGIGAVKSIPGSQKDEEIYGKTESSDFQTYYYSGKFGVDLFYQEYRGFYSEKNETGFLSDVRNDLKMQNSGINLYYIFSDKFSIKAAFTQTEKQLKTGFSVILGFSASYFKIGSERSLVPVESEPAMGDFSGYRGGEYKTFAIMPGGGYTQVIDNDYYMTIFFMMGGGVAFVKDDVDSGRISKTTDVYKVDAKYGVGYNSDSILAGGAIVLDLTVLSFFTSSSVKLGSGVTYIEFYAGIRI